MEIEKTFSALTEDSDIPLIIATDIEQFVISPITFWCKIHAPEVHKDPPPSLYQQRLFDQGHAYQAEVIGASYTGAVEKRFYDENEGFRLTLELMVAGERNIKNMPVMCRPLGLQGRPDVLTRVDDAASELGSYSYSVVEIKTARNIQKAHILQGAVYNRLVGVVQGYEPPKFYITNRDGATQAIQMADVNDELDQVLSDMRAVMEGRKVIDPCYGGGRWPWETYVNNLAVQANDVSLIPGVGVAIREGLIREGYRTVEAVANARGEELTKVPRVGKTTARKFITVAQAIHEARPVRRDHDLQLPSGH